MFRIAAAVSEHLYAVARLVVVKSADAAFYIAGVEKFHIKILN